jgi:hypothetical protein
LKNLFIVFVAFNCIQIPKLWLEKHDAYFQVHCLQCVVHEEQKIGNPYM